MNGVAILTEGLGKEYRIGRGQTGYKTFRDTVAHTVKSQLRAVGSAFSANGKREPSYETIWALKDISFQINTGEVVGIIGRNGAGKSTLLKVLSRITEPTVGFADLEGRVGSLLEVGTGFHPELTGRENILLNGAILGMRRDEILRKFDQIVDFAEVGKFVDTPVKHYSSGMYLRLAFAVAAHLETEILLVDEVLAVGDASFQKKCLGKMGEVAEAGRTILFVSHNMSAVNSLCSRAIWINDGSVAADGPVDDVAQAYLETMSNGSFTYFSQSYNLDIQKVLLKNSMGETTSLFAPGEDLIVEIWFNSKNRIERPFIWLKVESLRGACFAANMLLDGNTPEVLEGEGSVICRFKSIPLLPQSYTIVMAVRANDRDAIVDPREVASFSVVGDLWDYGFKGESKSVGAKSTPVVVPYEWTLPDGSIAPVELRLSPLETEVSRLQASK